MGFEPSMVAPRYRPAIATTRPMMEETFIVAPALEDLAHRRRHRDRVRTVTLGARDVNQILVPVDVLHRRFRTPSERTAVKSATTCR